MAVVDPETLSVSPATVIANDGRYLAGLLPRDATRVLAIFTKGALFGEDSAIAIVTQMIEITPSLRRRAALH
jgi:hypothetical protein